MSILCLATDEYLNTPRLEADKDQLRPASPNTSADLESLTRVMTRLPHHAEFWSRTHVAFVLLLLLDLSEPNAHAGPTALGVYIHSLSNCLDRSMVLTHDHEVSPDGAQLLCALEHVRDACSEMSWY